MRNNLQKKSKRNYANTISILGKFTRYFDTQVLSKCRHENSRRHHRRACGTIRTEVRNQTEAKYLNGPIFSDFCPKSDFIGQKGPKMVLF